MEKSESINELAEALCKVQHRIEDAAKDRDGYNYKYADLSQILQIVRPALTDFGLSVSQFPCDGGENIALDTILMHSSGQWLSNKYSMPVEVAKGMSRAQASGSVITYMRRYALAAIIGITQEDDDAAAKRETKKVASEPKISAEQVSYLYPFVTEEGEGGALQWSVQGQMIFQEYKINVVEDLPASKFNELKQRLEASK